MLDEKKYNIILSDPPWSYHAWSGEAVSRWVGQHYPVMDIEDIKALDVNSIAADDCALFLWATPPCLPEAMAVISAWEFTYKTIAFVWVKINPKARTPFWGMGHWTRANAELCLLATRGSPKRQSAAVHQIVMVPRGRHSEKPAEVRDKIVELMGDLPRIELFAREKTDGWAIWGNEIDNDVVIGRV